MKESILTLEVSDCIIYLCALPYAHIFSPAASDASLSTENLSISECNFPLLYIMMKHFNKARKSTYLHTNTQTYKHTQTHTYINTHTNKLINDLH